jgi:hypothetical protein
VNISSLDLRFSSRIRLETKLDGLPLRNVPRYRFSLPDALIEIRK